MMVFKFIFSSQRFSVKTRRIYASIAGLLQVNSTQLALKIAARDRFIIQSSGLLLIPLCEAFIYDRLDFYYAIFDIKIVVQKAFYYV